MKTQKAIQKFHKKANEWLIDLENIDSQKISVNPKQDSWSLSELYDHIMRVARTYQIPNFHNSSTSLAVRKKRKNKYGIAIFNLGLRMQVQIQMQRFPAPLVTNFTPQKRTKEDLIKDFKTFIHEVNELENNVLKSSKNNKHYHPMFGDINTLEWFSLIEIHMSHHDIQKERIMKYLKSL